MKKKTPEKTAKWVSRVVEYLRSCDRRRAALSQLGVSVPKPGRVGGTYCSHLRLDDRFTLMGNEMVSLSVEEEEEDWLEQVANFLRTNGPTALSQLGAMVRRPSGVRGTYTACLRADSRFIFVGNDRVSLSMEEEEEDDDTMMSLSSSEEEAYWLESLFDFVRAEGPTTLSVLGGAVRRPPGVTSSLSALMRADDRFDYSSDDQVVSLVYTEEDWLEQVANFLRTNGPTALSQLGAMVRRPSGTRGSYAANLRADNRFIFVSNGRVSLSAHPHVSEDDEEKDEEEDEERDEDNIVSDWLDMVAAHLNVNGCTLLSTLGMVVRRPPGIRGTYAFYLQSDGRFVLSSDGFFVSLLGEDATPSTGARAESLRELEKNKGGIIISNPITFGEHNELNINDEYTAHIRIENASDVDRVLEMVRVMDNESLFSVPHNVNTIVRSNDTVELSANFRSSSFGVFKTMFLFQFHGFRICRISQVMCGDVTMHDALRPTSSFVAPSRRRRDRLHGRILAGIAPSGSSGGYVNSVLSHDIPREWRAMPLATKRERIKVTSNELHDALEEHLAAVEGGGQRHQLVMQRYDALYMQSLWFEEIELENNMLMYKMNNVIFEGRGNLLALRVPHLAEKRPSVMTGDEVIAVHADGSNDNNSYKSYVHFVELNFILLKFHRKFDTKHQSGMRYNVEFIYPRRTIRLIYQGMWHLRNRVASNNEEDCAHLSQLLFPQRSISSISDIPSTPASESESQPNMTVNPSTTPSTTAPIQHQAPIHNPSLADLMGQYSSLNIEQQGAVSSILERFSGNNINAPYVVFGPPGTGKTVTVVESILQISRRLAKDEHILVCAPSNTAVDLIVERLANGGVVPDEMFRLMAYQRKRSDVSEMVHQFCEHNGEGYVCPPLSKLKRMKTIVATCSMAGKLYNYGIEEGFFRAVIIDEAGHCWEPEVIGCLAWQLSRNGLLVLAGDPKQLGPVTHSVRTTTAAIALPSSNDDEDSSDESNSGEISNNRNQPTVGLPVSMLERFVETVPVYSRSDASGSYDSLYISKLVKCYRCHPSILRGPNQLFYDNDLEDYGGEVAHSLEEWEGLVTPGFPVIFHGVLGENQQEGNSPSWFNEVEILEVLAYVTRLLESGVSPIEIGVITPYHKQVQKIKTALRLREIEGITVGSCEQFQGQERRVIIISTVRTAEESIDHDIKFKLGFVSNPKRFNVALTRAQALLIVVGSTSILSTDPCWKKLIDYCVQHGGYIGMPRLFSDDDTSSQPPEQDEEEQHQQQQQWHRRGFFRRMFDSLFSRN